jgi:hypothetical protein
MRALREVVRRFGSWFRRRELEDRLSEEIRFHVEQQIEEHLRAGMAPDEARRLAMIRFGGVEHVREQTRDEFRAAPLEHLARDVRYGLRSLRRHPGFTAMAVLSLAMGIGANAAIFGVAYAVLFRQSPLADPDTLVNIYEAESAGQFNPMSYPNIEDLRRGTTQVFSGIAASTFTLAQIDRGGTVATVMGEAVTGGAFALLGIEPELGRAIQPSDDVARGGHPVVMLSHGYWQRAFGGDPGVVGRTLQMGRRGYTIIGVAPADYRGGLPAVTPAFFVPMTMQNELMGIEMLDQRYFHSILVKARLSPGVTRAQAEHAASLVAASLSAARPEGWIPGQRFELVPTSDVQVVPGVDPLLRAAAWLLIAVVGLVLLLACTNLASFLVARAVDRGQEIAVRRALGASRGALARQVLVESALLGLGGAAAGLGLALALLQLLLSVDLPLPYGIRLDLQLGLSWKTLFDWRVLAFTGRRRRDRGSLSRTASCHSRHARRSWFGAEGGQQRQRGAGPSQVAQRDGRRPDRHVARAARGRRAVLAELAGRRWRWTRASDGRRRLSCRSSCRWRGQHRMPPRSARGGCSNGSGRCRGPRPSASSGRCRSNSRPVTQASPSTVACRRPAGRRFAPHGPRWMADSSTPPV